MTTRTSSPETEPAEELTRFQKFARALFRVGKREVPKHEPKKRNVRQQNSRAAE